MCLPSRASEKNETATFHASPRQRHVWGASLDLEIHVISRNLLRPTTDRSLTGAACADHGRHAWHGGAYLGTSYMYMYSTDDTVLWPHFSAAHAQGDAFHGRRPLPLQ
jgi:hypothetical protein